MSRLQFKTGAGHRRGRARQARPMRAGEAPMLCAAVCCVPSASALGSGRGGAACGLEVCGPVLWPPEVGDLGAGFVAEDRAQWRRGGPLLGERP